MKDIKGFFSEYRWLSNFWPANINYNDFSYPSVEHAYQVAKLDEGDKKQNILDQITHGQLPLGKDMKRVGKLIKPRSDWNDVRLQVMEDLLRIKFSDANPELKQQLIDTKSAYLEETNSWGDTFWGVCRDEGENHLGRLLMEIRSEIQ